MNRIGFESIDRWGNMRLNHINDTQSEDTIESIPLIPGESMGNLKLGMSREDLFKALNKPYEVATLKQDKFADLGLTIQYKNDQVILLESDGTWPLFLDGFNIFNASFSECVALIKSKDSKADDSIMMMVRSDVLGIGITTNMSEDKPPYLVAIFPPKTT